MALALYRTYRPGRLADVIGQDHVTVPLARALDSGRVHHAYLFTGPRGCGKTSTARILARSLNCVAGPTSEPCGTCQSCQDLAPNGPGSIDVVEMDAATNRGIDDARELREKAMYAPAASRYKVFIIDEAHQLTKEAWNALLKLIEEPPAHLRFVFATTEPDAVLPTIRSRTHQYPFRLVPTRRLQEHLAWTCEQENVPADPAALTLVARAAQGSVRDAQSILGQLIAGSGADGITQADAVAQLGFTDAAVLDRLVDALVAGDGRALYAVIEEVVEAGTDPRRFATDLLERLRDLLVLQQVPDAASVGLLEVPDSELDAMARQSAALGTGQLSRAADLVSAGLSELKGSTAPRLQLELLGARLLLPAADDSASGVLARLDRVEHRLALHGTEPGTTTEPGIAAAPARTAPPERAPFAQPTPAAPPPDAAMTAPPPVPPAPPRTAPPAAVPPAPPRLSTVTGAAATPAPDAAAAPAATSAEAALDLTAVRAAWPQVLATVLERSRVAHTLVDGTTVQLVSGTTVVVAHPEASRLDFLRRSAAHLATLSEAVAAVTGTPVELDLVLGGGTAPPAGSGAAVPAERPSPPPVAEDDDAAPDDPDADEGDSSPLALLQRELGGSVVEEYDRP